MSPWWVAPFGNLRINGHLHLPAAYRSLSRPSSPQRAKASSVRPFLLSLAIGHNITAVTGFLLYAFLLKLCFFHHVNELLNLKIPKFENLKMNPKLIGYNKTTECFFASAAILY